MKILIKNIDVVTDDGILKNANCVVEDGIILSVGYKKCLSDTVIDGSDCYLLAGFIDLHCHGGNGYDFMDATAEQMLEIAGFHLKHGTTTLFATTMTDSWENIEHSLKTYRSLFNENRLLTLTGVHLEGPWFSPEQCGAQDSANMELPSISKIDELLAEYPFIKRISMAPELDGAIQVGNYAHKKGIVVSAGHTNADFDTIVKSSNNGFTLLTHFYSGMSGVVRKNAYRVAGAVEAGYYLDDMYVEIIADGRHLPVSLLKLIYKIKRADHICLITDGTRGCGYEDGKEFMLGRQKGGVRCIVDDGVAKLPDFSAFGGSIATTDRLFRQMIDAGVDIVDVSKMASATPAKIMGLSDRGVIEVGKRADLVIMDRQYRVKNVITKGNLVFNDDCGNF